MCNTPFEELYKPRANFNGFTTSPPCLPVWILAFFKILYNRLGKTDEYLLDWKDEVDNHMEFNHIKCSLWKPESAELIWNLLKNLKCYCPRCRSCMVCD